MKYLLKYLTGYMYVKLEGFFVERVINTSMNRRISLWNIKRDKSTIVYANIGFEDYDEIKSISENNKCQLEILKKAGVPFLIEKYKKRKVLIGSIAFVAIFLLVISRFIWNIQINRFRNNR